MYIHSSRARADKTQAPPYAQIDGTAVRFAHTLTFVDRTWTLVTVPLNNGHPPFPDWPTGVILLAGVLATATLSLYLFDTIRRTAHLQELTRSLEFTTESLRAEVAERQKNEEQILQMARHDTLTGLANRRSFVEAVKQAILHAQRGPGFAVLYLDLDRFKDVNDTLGHPVGDRLLQAVSERLRECLRATDLVARFGGDEFAVLAADIDDPADVGILADKLLKVFARPFLIEGNEIRAGTSIGIDVYGPTSNTAELLLSHADVALYRAKTEERGTYRFFTDEMDVEVRSRVVLDGEMQQALARREFFLVYQPEVNLETGRITGIEALVRWQHPARGIVGPDAFVPAAEKNGLIVPLTRFVLEEACRQAREWLEAGIALPVVAVNLSAVCFKRPVELTNDIDAALTEIGLSPELLEVELTETALMHTARDHMEVLRALRERGVRVAIDDFGTGYSSLDYLRRFPVDRIKIAQDFVADIDGLPGNAVIVRAAIDLAHALNIHVVAEGVETEEQLKLLREWRCREAQGFYFAGPLPAPAVEPLLRRGVITPAVAKSVGRAA
jgi:diguanylate cyclase (GGDEF)-like protein